MNPFRFLANAVHSIFGDNRLWTSVGGSRSTTAKIDVSEESALNYSAVWAATRLICGTCANFTLPVYRSGDYGETREKLPTHPVSRLLNVVPNSEMDAFNFRSVMWQWQINWGNAFAEIVREGNNPEGPVMELWPIHPSRVKLLRDEADQLYYEVYNFGQVPPTELDQWQMLHLPNVITYDGIVGHGVIQHARETIGSGIAAETRAANTFGNGGIPRAVIEHPGKWAEENRNSFRKEWKELYTGKDPEGVALLGGGATMKPMLGLSEKDSQYLETRQFSVEEIARWYNIPPHLLHHLLRATFNNVEELGIDFVRYCLLPLLGIWHAGIRRKLFTPDEQTELFVEHDVDELMDGNAQSRAQLHQTLVQAGIKTRNECRKTENLDPVPGGDVFLVQGAMVPLGDDGKPISEFVSGGATPDAGKPAKQMNAVAGSVQQIFSRDLAFLLTKESNRMRSFAKNPADFVDKVDEFYTAHRTMFVDVVSVSATALRECGYEIDTGAIAAQWVNDGKALMMDAAGAATPTELPEAVQRVIESTTWSERPEKAIERVKNAIAS